MESLVVAVAVGCASRVKVASYILKAARQSFEHKLSQFEHRRMTKTLRLPCSKHVEGRKKYLKIAERYKNGRAPPGLLA
jgi:hypothetical protein